MRFLKSAFYFLTGYLFPSTVLTCNNPDPCLAQFFSAAASCPYVTVACYMFHKQIVLPYNFSSLYEVRINALMIAML